MSINTIIFDFGRVISAQKPPELFEGYERELGLAPDTLNPLMFDAPLWGSALVGEIDMDTYWQRIGPRLGLATPNAIRRFQARYYQDEALNLGVHRLLLSLKERYTLSILSNHPAGLMDWLRDWALDTLFDDVVCSGEVGVAKPSPAIFTLALERLGAVAEETVFIDDTQGHIAAARELGIHGCHFSEIGQLALDLERLGVDLGDRVVTRV